MGPVGHPKWEEEKEMADTPSAPTTGPESSGEQSQEQVGQQVPQGGEDGAEKEPEDPQAELEKWKAMARKNEANAKKAEADAKAWREYQDSRKTEEQKANEEREKLIAQRDEALRGRAIYEAGAKHGLSPEALELLDGVPTDQLPERAEKLAAMLAPPRTPSPSAGIGQETPPGAANSGDWLRDALTKK